MGVMDPDESRVAVVGIPLLADKITDLILGASGTP